MTAERAARLTAAVEAGLTGDADAAVEVFADDAVLVDTVGEPPVEGVDAILQFFLAYGGRREVATVHDAFVAGGRGGLSYTVWFRADAHAYAQHGRALLTVDDDGLITRWDGVWVEHPSDLAPWAGD